MAKIIFTSRYHKNIVSKRGNLLSYMGTREGVEKIQNTPSKDKPPTKEQDALIKSLIKKCPEVKEYSEQDYKNNQINLTNLNVIWYNSSNFPFVLRNRINGDKIKINNGTKKVKDLLIDEKIPVEDRDNLLMISKDDEIINIFGVKKSSTLLNTKNNNILISLREKNNATT